MPLNRLFVYGSLMRSGRHAGLLRSARFLGEARTCEAYLLHLGWTWPLLIEQAPPEVSAPVCGEVYAVPVGLWPKLDALEDEGTLYRRRVIEVCLKNGERLEAWCYFAHADWLIRRALTAPRFVHDLERGCQHAPVAGRRQVPSRSPIWT